MSELTSRPLIVAANWKMNGTRATTLEWLSVFLSRLPEWGAGSVIIFPPYLLIDSVVQAIKKLAHIECGAQNVAEFENGAYTGEISASMLFEAGCRSVLVGHSERRQLLFETDAIVAKKFLLAKQFGLSPVLCVGETLEQRQAGMTHQIVLQQIEAVVKLAKGAALFRNAMIAYEPVWAIGTGESATADQAQEVHALIREHVASYDVEIAQTLPILYGGSVKPGNAAELFAMPDIDGGLVGGASLNAEDFLEIVLCTKSF